MKAEAESNAEEDKKRVERISKLNAAEQIIYKSEKDLEDLKDKITDEQKAKVTEALEGLKALYNVEDANRDIAAISAATENLAKIWFEISASIYKADSSGGQQFDPNMFGQMFGGQPK
jgi:molecular chaperone DnaK